MANPPRTRKRVHAIRRAPNGSAFEKCDHCGVMVAITLADMHECGNEKNVKKFRGICGRPNVAGRVHPDQPRSAFRIFMETFVAREAKNSIDNDRMGFEIWKNMSEKEREPYVSQAENVNSSYTRALLEEEADKIPKRDDEAGSHSAMVGIFEQNWVYENPEDYETSEIFETYRSGGINSLNTIEWEMLQSWTPKNSSSS